MPALFALFAGSYMVWGLDKFSGRFLGERLGRHSDGFAPLVDERGFFPFDYAQGQNDGVELTT